MSWRTLHTGLVVVALAACSQAGEAHSKPPSAPSEKAASKPAESASAASAKPSADSAASKPTEAAERSAALEDPSKATLKAPDTFTVKLATTEGDILIDVKRAWAPNGADRFYNLVKAGYYDDTAFFRVIGGFMAQIGISGDPELNAVWRQARIPDDPVRQSNTRGYVSFAMAGPNTRTTQIFINYRANDRLDGMGFSPFGKVRDGSMKVVDALYAGYGEGAPRGRGPAQGRLQQEGNAYLKRDFPELDYVEKATVVEE